MAMVLKMAGLERMREVTLPLRKSAENVWHAWRGPLENPAARSESSTRSAICRLVTGVRTAGVAGG